MTIEGVPHSMTAVQVVEYNKPYKIQQAPVPQSLGEYEMLLKTAVASLCHTDHMVLAGIFPAKLPMTGSHEGTGVVVAVGSKVSGFKRGDRVMSGLQREPCGKCVNCQYQGSEDRDQYCQSRTGSNGINVDGYFSDYHIADSRTTFLLPDNVSFEIAAPLACAGLTIYRAIKVSGLQSGQWLGIVGSGGGLGHMGIQFAKALGLKVIGIDARDEGIDLSTHVGADHVLDAREGNQVVVKKVQELTGGSGVDASINVSDHPTAAALSCAMTRMHGTMVQVSQPDNVSIPFKELVFRNIKVHGSLFCGHQWGEEMVELVSRNGIHVETKVFHGLDKVPEMIELSHSGKLKGKAICIVNQI